MSTSVADEKRQNETLCRQTVGIDARTTPTFTCLAGLYRQQDNDGPDHRENRQEYEMKKQPAESSQSPPRRAPVFSSPWAALFAHFLAQRPQAPFFRPGTAPDGQG
ncbi:hypothetical protein [Elongatibacter sediminis]|uniref:Uncharacterized protein n=1 Tax=Elongatibacter sediminis TaxID=3119006 RepID=A0AAW9RJ56_9GAMM